MRKGGGIGVRLDPSQLPRIFEELARRAGRPNDLVEGLSRHSMRVGAAQDMIACGVGLLAIQQAGRWKPPRHGQPLRGRLLAGRSGAAQLARMQSRE